MATVQKIVLSASRDIPFNKLILSQSNVRRVKAGVSIEELADDIARRTLLQSLTVRAVCDAEGNETGMYEIPAGGRRYRALELLVRQKRLAKTAPSALVRCEAAKLDQTGLIRVKRQRVLLHSLAQGTPESSSIRLALKPNDDVVGVTYDDHVARRFAPSPALSP